MNIDLIINIPPKSSMSALAVRHVILTKCLLNRKKYRFLCLQFIGAMLLLMFYCLLSALLMKVQYCTFEY